jgi:hypothetical protein
VPVAVLRAMARRAGKERDRWSAKLTRLLTLKDGTKLVTLADAHVCLIGCRTVTFPSGVARGTDRAIELGRKSASFPKGSSGS